MNDGVGGKCGGGGGRWGPRGDWIEGNIPVVGVIAGRDPQKYNIHTNHNTSILHSFTEILVAVYVGQVLYCKL